MGCDTHTLSIQQLPIYMGLLTDPKKHCGFQKNSAKRAIDCTDIMHAICFPSFCTIAGMPLFRIGMFSPPTVRILLLCCAYPP